MTFDFAGKGMGVEHNSAQNFSIEEFQGYHEARASTFSEGAGISGNRVANCYSIIGQYPIFKIRAFGIMLNEKPGH